MSFLDRFRILLRMHHLIRRKATGTPLEFARRLELSKASLYRYIDDLKALGAPVVYCRVRGSFMYGEEWEIGI